MPAVPGLRSPYCLVGRIVFLGRMLDKIRLHADGRLPEAWVRNLGDGNPNFHDWRCCQFLGVAYADVVRQVQAGKDDAAMLAWVQAHGTPRSDFDCELWNHFMTKLGWRDARAAHIRQRVKDAGYEGRGIETSFDFIELDEGREPVTRKPWELRPAMAVIVMGVAGSGKTTVGARLAQELGWSFKDADDFHPPANVAKMAAGAPLDDEDRAPWLLAIREHLAAAIARGESAVVTCSALREKYRGVLVSDPQRVKIVCLRGDFELILKRIAARQGHFFKEHLLRSQFEALEMPEGALAVDVALSPEEIVALIRKEYGV